MDLVLIYPSSREVAYDVEQFFIDLFRSQNLSLNSSSDARLNGKDVVWSEERKARHSEMMTGKSVTQGTRDILSRLLTGRQFSSATRSRMSESAKRSLAQGERLERLREMAKVGAKKISIDGKIYGSITEAAIALNIGESTVAYRLKSSSKNFNHWRYLETDT